MHKPSAPLRGIIAAILISLLAGQAALAQPPSAQAVHCAEARNPERCAARQRARALCGDKRGAERRQCVKERTPPPDCGKAADPARCIAMQAAQESCKAKMGPAQRRCLRDAMPSAKP
jgi:hypothetical protein